jgi:hypothetical protein
MTNRERRSGRSGRPPLLSPGRPPVAGREASRRASPARTLRLRPACRRLSEQDGSGRRAACHQRYLVDRRRCSPGDISRLWNARSLRSYVRKARACGRSAGGWDGRRRRSRGSCDANAATRSGGLDYRATTAQWHADRAARRPKPVKLAVNLTLRTCVQDRLAGVIVTPKGIAIAGPSVSWKGRRHGPRQDRRWASAWSLEQIAHRLRLDSPHDETMRISHESIYQSLYIQGRGALRRDLTACLRTGRALSVPRPHIRGRGKAFIMLEIMIIERPAEVGDRAVPGHWEGDLILGLDSSAIGTLVESTTRFTMLLHLPRMAEHGVGGSSEERTCAGRAWR